MNSNRSSDNLKCGSDICGWVAIASLLIVGMVVIYSSILHVSQAIINQTDSAEYAALNPTP
jgi:hypothetical protein